MQTLVVPKPRIIPPSVKELDPLVTLLRAEVSSGETSDTFAVQVARHRIHQDIFYGVSHTDGPAFRYVYRRLYDSGGAPVKELKPLHLDRIIAGILQEGFGETIEPRAAGNLNAGLYDQLNAKLRPYFV